MRYGELRPIWGNAETVEKGSFATTVTQEAHKEGKGEDGRGQMSMAQLGLSWKNRVDIATRPDRHPARMLTLGVAGRAITSCLWLLSRREASGLKNAHAECGGVR
jgi:hypothetical protein